MLSQIDLSRADLNLLVLFEAVLEEGNVGRAADRLNLSASAVSHGLGRLRRMLNDPLFLRTPRGVVPTERGLALAAPIAEVLSKVRGVLSSAEPFDPKASGRRFVIAAPDGASAALLPSLLQQIRHEAPGISLGLRQLLPAAGETTPARAWRQGFNELEARVADIAIMPIDEAPARFHRAPLFEEDFVIAVRQGHPFADRRNLESYCKIDHLVVSATADPRGFVDDLLAAEGRERRVALTVPDFMLALATVAETDLACAVPRRFMQAYGERFALVAVEAPFAMSRFHLTGVVLQSALADLGLAWLIDQIAAVARRAP